MTTSDIRDYCGQIYVDTYTQERQRIESEILADSRTGDIPASKEGDIETASQKEAIKKATIEGIKHFPNTVTARVA